MSWVLHDSYGVFVEKNIYMLFEKKTPDISIFQKGSRYLAINNTQFPQIFQVNMAFIKWFKIRKLTALRKICY